MEEYRLQHEIGLCTQLLCVHTSEIIPFGGLGDDKPDVSSLRAVGYIASFHLSAELLL